MYIVWIKKDSGECYDTITGARNCARLVNICVKFGINPEPVEVKR